MQLHSVLLLSAIMLLPTNSLLSVGFGADDPVSTPKSLRLPAAIQYGEPKKICDLACPAITESSGLAVSRLRPEVYWTHNDSGDRPRLFAISSTGEDLGTYSIPNAQSHDWEDIASFTLDGKHLLLIGDIGNNRLLRDEGQLYLVRESYRENAPADQRELAVERTIRFRYADERRDSEAVAVDPTQRMVLLASKHWTQPSRIYAFKLPLEGDHRIITAERIATVKVPGVTAMDVSADGRRAIILSYGNAYEWTRYNAETWQTAFSRPGREIQMPVRMQGESICYAADGIALLLTSEKRPTPLFLVAPRGDQSFP